MTSSTIARASASLLAALAACAHAPRPAVLSSAADRRCEDAFFFFSAPRPSSAADRARQVATTPLSWAATAGGFGADAALRVTLGVGGGLLVCGPIAAAEGALHLDAELSGECFGAAVRTFVTNKEIPSAGIGARRATRTWRCPDLAPFAREARDVAGCYAERAMPADVERARAVLLSVRESPRIWDCLPGREQRAIDAALSRLPAGDAPQAGATAEP